MYFSSHFATVLILGVASAAILYVIFGPQAIALPDKSKSSISEKHKNSILLVLLSNSLIHIVGFSLLALLINMTINFEAFQFQFGFRRHVDSTLLKSYVNMRDNFIYIGALSAVFLTFSQQYRAKVKKQKSKALKEIV